jgi:hypothetical protein
MERIRRSPKIQGEHKKYFGTIKRCRSYSRYLLTLFLRFYYVYNVRFCTSHHLMGSTGREILTPYRTPHRYDKTPKSYNQSISAIYRTPSGYSVAPMSYMPYHDLSRSKTCLITTSVVPQMDEATIRPKKTLFDNKMKPLYLAVLLNLYSYAAQAFRGDVVHLNSKTFEHDTQAATGQTTGIW